MTSLLIDRSKTIDVVAVGSWTNFDHLFRVDRIPQRGDTVRITSPIEQVETTYYGGCALNNISTAAKLGAKTGIITIVGEDFKCRSYYKYLDDLHVNLNGLIQVQGKYCGHSFLFADPHGDAICLSQIGVSEQQEDFEPNADMLSNSKVVVINYHFDRFTVKAAKIAHMKNCLVIASGSLTTSPEYVIDILKNTDLLICTEHELEQILQQCGFSDESITRLYQIGIQAIIETHGVDGSMIRTPEQTYKVPAVLSKNVVDPVGAGDAFTGGVAAGLAFKCSLEDSVELGATVASFVIEAMGCQTNQPTREQVIARLKENGKTLNLQ